MKSKDKKTPQRFPCILSGSREKASLVYQNPWIYAAFNFVCVCLYKFLTNSLSKSIYSRHWLTETHYWSSGERALVLSASTVKLNCSGRRLMCFQERCMSPNIWHISLRRVRDYTNTYELSKKPKNLFHVLKPKFFSTIYSFCHILKKMKSVIFYL